MNLFTRKPRIQLVPCVVDEDSDSSTVRTSPDEEQNKKINISSQISCENAVAKRKRKRKLSVNADLEKQEVLSTGNDSSTSTEFSRENTADKTKKKQKLSNIPKSSDIQKPEVL